MKLNSCVSIFIYVEDMYVLYNLLTSYNHHILSLTSWEQQPVIAFNLIVLKYLDNFDCLLQGKLQLPATPPTPQHHTYLQRAVHSGRIDYSSILSALVFCV